MPKRPLLTPMQYAALCAILLNNDPNGMSEADVRLWLQGDRPDLLPKPRTAVGPALHGLAGRGIVEERMHATGRLLWAITPAGRKVFDRHQADPDALYTTSERARA